MLYTKCIFGALKVLMRKTILLFILFAIPFLGNSQSKSITIYWGDSKPTVNTVGSTNTSFSLKEKALEELKLQMDKNVVLYRTQWEDAGFVDKHSITVSNVRYGAVSSPELQKNKYR